MKKLYFLLFLLLPLWSLGQNQVIITGSDGNGWATTKVRCTVQCIIATKSLVFYCPVGEPPMELTPIGKLRDGTVIYKNGILFYTVDVVRGIYYITEYVIA